VLIVFSVDGNSYCKVLTLDIINIKDKRVLAQSILTFQEKRIKGTKLLLSLIIEFSFIIARYFKGSFVVKVLVSLPALLG